MYPRHARRFQSIRRSGVNVGRWRVRFGWRRWDPGDDYLVRLRHRVSQIDRQSAHNVDANREERCRHQQLWLPRLSFFARSCFASCCQLFQRDTTRPGLSLTERSPKLFFGRTQTMRRVSCHKDGGFVSINVGKNNLFVRHFQKGPKCWSILGLRQIYPQT